MERTLPALCLMAVATTAVAYAAADPATHEAPPHQQLPAPQQHRNTGRDATYDTRRLQGELGGAAADQARCFPADPATTAGLDPALRPFFRTGQDIRAPATPSVATPFAFGPAAELLCPRALLNPISIASPRSLGHRSSLPR